MYLRIVHGQPKPGQVNELARRWEALMAPRLRQMAGLRTAYFIGNSERNTAAGVTLWEQLPDDGAIGPVMRAFQEEVADLTDGPPRIEDYEILATA